jgi:hypothetical protein
MRQVCVSGAEKLVVQDVEAARPPFRILSTWPADVRSRGSADQKAR